MVKKMDDSEITYKWIPYFEDASMIPCGFIKVPESVATGLKLEW